MRLPLSGHCYFFRWLSIVFQDGTDSGTGSVVVDAEICKIRYDIDATLNDFFRIQKVVHEQSEKYVKDQEKHKAQHIA